MNNRKVNLIVGVVLSITAISLNGEAGATAVTLQCDVKHDTRVLAGDIPDREGFEPLGVWKFRIDEEAKTVESKALVWLNGGDLSKQVTAVEFTADVISFCLLEGGCPGEVQPPPKDTALAYVGKVRIDRKTGRLTQRRVEQIGPPGGRFSSTLEDLEVGNCEKYEEPQNKF